MAAVCPSCEHIHFETNRAALPSHCASCGHDLAEPFVPPTAAPEPPPPVARGVSRSFLSAAVAVLCVGGWLLLSGVAERDRYRPATATMTVGYLDWAPAEGRGQLFRQAGDGQGGNSYYLVDGKKYTTTIDRRWRVSDHFEVWYLPESPETASEIRPFGKLLAALFLMVVGLFLFGLAFGIFGAALDAPAERLQVPIPTPADADEPPGLSGVGEERPA